MTVRLMKRMPLAALTATIFLTVSCQKKYEFSATAASKWSNSVDVQLRTKATVYSYSRTDGSVVAISTTELDEEPSGFVYDRGAILKQGFLVYPGGTKVDTIQQAIQICETSKGATFQKNSPSPSP